MVWACNGWREASRRSADRPGHPHFGVPTPREGNSFDDGDDGDVEPGRDRRRPLRGLRDDAPAAASDPLVPAHPVLLRPFLAPLDGNGPADPPDASPRDVPQLLRPLIAAGPAERLGHRADRRLRPAALVDRYAAQRRRGRPAGFRALCVLQRRHVLHPGLWRRHPDRPARPGPGRSSRPASGSASSPSSSATCRCCTRRSRGARSRSTCSTPVPARPRRPGRCWPATPGTATWKCWPTSFAEWERWAAEVLESHISFPVLSFLPLPAR